MYYFKWRAYLIIPNQKQKRHVNKVALSSFFLMSFLQFQMGEAISKKVLWNESQQILYAAVSSTDPWVNEAIKCYFLSLLTAEKSRLQGNGKRSWPGVRNLIYNYHIF